VSAGPVVHVRAELARLDEPWERRRPELFALKRERMAAGAVPFFRATAALFFARLREQLRDVVLDPLEPLARWLGGDADAARGRVTWCAGDVHVENFGAYKASDGVLRFGLNDFDDAVVAPLEVDVLRLASSTLIAARGPGADAGPESLALARRVLERYARHLAAAGAGEARDPGAAELAEGAVRDLLGRADDASRREFLDKRAPVGKGGKRAFVPSDRYRPVAAEERALVFDALERAVAGLGESAHERKGYYRPIDVAARVAGLGSLGVARYAIVAEGKGKDAEDNVLLELKEAKPASVARIPIPELASFADEAARVIEGQGALRGERTPDLGRTTIEGRPFYLRRLSHREQRVALEALGAKGKTLEAIVDAEARALAGAHARSRRGLGLGALAAPGEDDIRAWLILACRLAGFVEADYLAFCSG
jgi:uncharacterized protein (DUF2252 family)